MRANNAAATASLFRSSSLGCVVYQPAAQLAHARRQSFHRYLSSVQLRYVPPFRPPKSTNSTSDYVYYVTLWFRTVNLT